MCSWVSSIPALSGGFVVSEVQLRVRPTSIFLLDSVRAACPDISLCSRKLTTHCGGHQRCSLSLNTARLLISPIQPPLPLPLVTDTFIPCLSFPSCYSRIITWWHIPNFNKSGPDFVVLHQAKLPLSLTFNAYENLQR